MEKVEHLDMTAFHEYFKRILANNDEKLYKNLLHSPCSTASSYCYVENGLRGCM